MTRDLQGNLLTRDKRGQAYLKIKAQNDFRTKRNAIQRADSKNERAWPQVKLRPIPEMGFLVTRGTGTTAETRPGTQPTSVDREFIALPVCPDWIRRLQAAIEFGNVLRASGISRVALLPSRGRSKRNSRMDNKCTRLRE